VKTRDLEHLTSPRQFHKPSNLFKLHITQEIYVILVIMYEEINGGLIVQLIAKTNIIKRDAKRHKSKVQMYNFIKSILVY